MAFSRREGLSSRVQMDTEAAPLVRKYCLRKLRVFPLSKMSSTTTRSRPEMSCWMAWVIWTAPEEEVEFP